MRRGLHHRPNKNAIIAYREGRTVSVHLSYHQLDNRVDRIARAFSAMRAGRGDVVTFQLPNCRQFVALALACARIGAVANPGMPIFRQHELNFMLNFGEPKVFIVPKPFQGFDYEERARGMLPCLPHLRQLVVVDGDGDDTFDRPLLRDDTAPVSGPGIAPDDVLLLMYISGTTGEPKGHTSNTLLSNLHAYIKAMELTAEVVILGASPMAHMTGYGYLAMAPIIPNATTVFQDIWEPKRALEMASKEGVTYCIDSHI